MGLSVFGTGRWHGLCVSPCSRCETLSTPIELELFPAWGGDFVGFPEFLGAREATSVVLLWGPNRDLLCVFISFWLSAMYGSTCLFYSAKGLSAMHGSTCLFYSAKELSTMHGSTCLFYSAKELTTMHGSACLFYSAKKLSRVLLIYRQFHIL